VARVAFNDVLLTQVGQLAAPVHDVTGFRAASG